MSFLASTPVRSPIRRWAFRLVLLLLGWLVVELVCWGLLGAVTQGGWGKVRRNQLNFLQMEFLENDPDSRSSQTQTFHPFVGWVRNPDVLKGETYEGTTLTTNRLGFLDTSEGLFQRSPQRLIVGIAGGSMAYQMSCAGAERIKQRLREIPEYRDREIVIVRLAQLAYKQPQGLLALNYYMLLGGEFDIVINLDGFNEITMSTVQNFRSQVAIDYPQGWNMRTAEIVPPRESDLALRLIEIRGQRRRMAKAYTRAPWNYLPSCALLWHLRDERIRTELIDWQLSTAQDNGQYSFLRCGPAPLATTEEAALIESVRIWKQASRQMHQLCSATGTLYIHAIQPNQYDPGSKPLTPEERALMDVERRGPMDTAYIPIIEQGYPLLRSAGEELRAEGVANIDLTRLFQTTNETLYMDSCCHVNPSGSERLADAICRFIQQEHTRQLGQPKR